MAQEADNIFSAAEVLRDARGQQKLSVEAVAKEICVRGCYLKAIEEGRYDDLPGKTFAIGFVKSYAKMLKLDEVALSEKFKSEYAAHLDPRGSAHKVDQLSSESNATNVSAKLGAGSQSIGDHSIEMVAPKTGRWPAWVSPVVGLVGAGMSWFLIGTTPTVSTIAAIDPVEEALTLAAFTTSASSELTGGTAVGVTGFDNEQTNGDIGLENANISALGAQKLEASKPEGHEPESPMSGFATGSLFLPAAHASNHVPSGVSSSSITFEAVEDSWVQLSYRDGTELWSGVLRAGQSYRPQLIGEVFLTTSNAGGIVLKQSDALFGPLGERGHVIESMALDASIFQSESFSDAAFVGAASGGSD